MSEIKVNSIKGVAASTAALTINNTDGTCTINNTNRTNKNLVINGAFLLSQRSTSSTADGYGSLDRFKVINNGTDEAPTHAQVDVASGTTPYTLGFRKALRVTNGNQTGGAGAGDFVNIQTKIESQDIANSGWNYTSSSSFITLSFWVKTSVAQNYFSYIKTSDGTARTFAFETGTLSADTWTKITKNFPGDSNLSFDSDNGEGLQINFAPFWGTDRTNNSVSLTAWRNYSSGFRTKDNTVTWYETDNATFEITGVQLEVGNVATDFEHRLIGDELLLCERYFQKFVAEFRMDGSSNGTIVYGTLALPTKMRAAPTISNSFVDTYNVNTGTLEDSHIDTGAICFGHRASGGGTRARREISLDAEL